jgi:site-specific recombinase XerC
LRDVDLDRREIVVRSGKGGKDRCVPLAEWGLPALRKRLRARHGPDRRDRAGFLEAVHTLASEGRLSRVMYLASNPPVLNV